MRKVVALTAVTLVFAVLMSITAAYSQERPSTDKTFTGQLMKVDSAANSISVKGADNKEMTFHYTEQTKIVGENSVQGLTGKPGTALKITYQEERGQNMATRIEVQK